MDWSLVVLVTTPVTVGAAVVFGSVFPGPLWQL